MNITLNLTAPQAAALAALFNGLVVSHVLNGLVVSHVLRRKWSVLPTPSPILAVKTCVNGLATRVFVTSSHALQDGDTVPCPDTCVFCLPTHVAALGPCEPGANTSVFEAETPVFSRAHMSSEQNHMPFGWRHRSWPRRHASTSSRRRALTSTRNLSRSQPHH